MRVHVKQDDGIAADKGHAPSLKGQILLDVRGIKALAKHRLFSLLQYSQAMCKRSSDSVCVCVCV